MDKEIKPETLYQGIKQRTSILTIVELSDTKLIMRERKEGTPDDQYFELKYKPRFERPCIGLSSCLSGACPEAGEDDVYDFGSSATSVFLDRCSIFSVHNLQAALMRFICVV